MKVGQLVAIACIVLGQKKYDGQYLTTCRSTAEEISQVILPEKVLVGKQVTYKPVKPGDEAVYGQILEIGNAVVMIPASEVSVDGKTPD